MRHERFSPGDGNAGAEGRPSNAIAKSIETTRPDLDLQATLDRAIRHQWRAEWLGSILAMRLDQRRLLVLGAGTLHGLEPELAEELAETLLADLRAGPPVPPFAMVKEEAELWAMFASPAERKFYMAAIWRELPPDDRRAFLRRAV